MAESAREIDLDPRKYVGLSFPLRADNNNDFALTKNSVQQSQHNLTNLLLTQIGERVGQPGFGSKLREFCFEQNDEELPEKIDAEIRRAVSVWRPYITIVDTATLTDGGDVNKIYVKIKYSTTLNPESLQTVTVASGVGNY